MAPRAFDIAQQLLECACEALEETEAECPDRSCVVAGALAWESCGDESCGQLSVQLVNQFASSSFPTPAATTAGQFGGRDCGHALVVASFTITILRCAPTGGPNGEPPSCESLSAAAQTAAIDAEAIMYATACCLSTMYAERDENGRRLIENWLTGTQTYVGPAGGCGGSALPVQVAIINNCACGD